jgi:hypothetical protein
MWLEELIMKLLARSGRDFRDRLDCVFRVINECADSGQQHAARNQVPSPENTSYARLAVLRLGGHLAGRLDARPAVLPGHGGARSSKQSPQNWCYDGTPLEESTKS